MSIETTPFDERVLPYLWRRGIHPAVSDGTALDARIQDLPAAWPRASASDKLALLDAIGAGPGREWVVAWILPHVLRYAAAHNPIMSPLLERAAEECRIAALTDRVDAALARARQLTADARDVATTPEGRDVASRAHRVASDADIPWAAVATAERMGLSQVGTWVQCHYPRPPVLPQ